MKELEDTLEIREAVTNAPGFQDSDNGKGSLARSQCISQSSSLFSLYLFVNPCSGYVLSALCDKIIQGG